MREEYSQVKEVLIVFKIDIGVHSKKLSLVFCNLLLNVSHWCHTLNFSYLLPFAIKHPLVSLAIFIKWLLLIIFHYLYSYSLVPLLLEQYTFT